MDIEWRSMVQGDTTVILVAGELTRESCPEFRTWASDAVRAASNVEMNCRDLTYLDSAGLGSFILLRKLVLQSGGRFQLSGVGGWLQKFLQVTGLEATFAMQ